MLFFGACALYLVVLCLSEAVWDPKDPRCELQRQKEKSYWDTEVLDQAYGWIAQFGRSSTYMVESAYNVEMRDLLRKGCDDYEKFKKTEFKCWSKEFLCSAKDTIKTTVDSFKKKKNLPHHRWYRWFETVRGHQADDREDEINWITKMRWNDPRLMYWAKDDLDQLGKKIFDRIFFYIEKNNIDSLKLVFDHYKNSGVMNMMKDQCNTMSRQETIMQCKLAIVFDRLAELMIDSQDIPWDMGSPPPRTREELSMLYLLQPKVYEIMDIGSKARNKTLCYRLKTMLNSLFDNALKMNGEKMKAHFGKFGSIYASMKYECAQTYKNDFEQMICFLSETFSRMNELGNSLGVDYSNWQSSRAQSMRAVVLVWLLLTPKGKFYVNTNELTTAQSAKELLKIMYKKIRGNEIVSLQEIANLIPSEDQMGLTSSDECTPNFDKISRDMKCGFKIVIENLAVFLGQYSSNDKKTKRLSLTVNHKERLQQFQISSIRGAVENTKLELKSSLEGFVAEIKKYFESSLGNRFSNLRQYYESLASFDLEIANADIGFINGKLDEFEKTAAALSKKLEYDSIGSQRDAVFIKSIDATFMWMKAIASGISAIFGAFKGEFDGFADASDAIDAAAKTTLEVVKGVAIAGQIEMTTSKFKIIADGLKENQNQLENTKNLIDKLNSKETNSAEFNKIQSDFFKSYNDYTPKVSAAQIAELDTAWSEVVGNLETLMDSMETKEGIAGATIYFVNNHFFKIKLVVPQLSQTLSDRYDFQFDLMDSLAAAVRAHTSMQGAKGLSQGFSDLERQLAESEKAQIALDQMALSTYILSQFHLLLILSQYCNYITYVNAGLESTKCTTALRTMNPVHIDDALSFSPPSCDVVRVSLKIPTSLSGKTDSINLNQLNSGESVPFQIPNFEWLMLNGEISANDRENALFVKIFEVYAITNDSYQIKTNLRVTVTPSGSAPVYPSVGQVKYELLPSSRTTYVFEYKENYKGNCESERNPYSVCSPGPKGICVQSRGELENELGAYPSIYSPWTIRLDKNIGNVPNPAKGTKLYLQAKLQLCRKTKDSNAKAHAGRKRFLSSLKKRKSKLYKYKDASSCPQGKYYNQDSGLFAACSADSTPQHNNYYCEMNQIDKA